MIRALHQNPLDLDDLIQRLQTPKGKSRCVSISEEEFLSLCSVAKESFQEQDTLLRLTSPINVCGDVHGQYSDLLKLFRVGGSPSTTSYLFLGDYVDRGPNSLEVICLLLALKSKYPEQFFLLRGNHELAPINRVFGFFSEVKRRFRKGNFMKLFLKVNDTFNYMPLAAVVDQETFCCHGGLSPALKSLRAVNAIQRPVYPTRAGLASDLMWSDPDEDLEDWEKQDNPEINPNHRGIGYLWGKAAHAQFLKKNKLRLLIRAHECVEQGYRWSFDKQLVTIFSAPNYLNGNHAAIAKFRPGGSLSFVTFR